MFVSSIDLWQVREELPRSAYHDYFAPDFCLNVAQHKNMDDCNTKAVGAGSSACVLLALCISTWHVP